MNGRSLAIDYKNNRTLGRWAVIFVLPYFLRKIVYVREIIFTITVINRHKSVKLIFILPTPFVLFWVCAYFVTPSLSITQGRNRPPFLVHLS